MPFSLPSLFNITRFNFLFISININKSFALSPGLNLYIREYGYSQMTENGRDQHQVTFLERCVSYGGVRQQRLDGIITPTHPFRYLLPSLSSKVDTYDNKQAFIH